MWLSESLATYMGFQVLSEATAYTGTWADFALSQKPRGYLAGYVPRYFPALADVAARRGPAVARILVRHGFPSTP